jgi:hypothetical protein
LADFTTILDPLNGRSLGMVNNQLTDDYCISVRQNAADLTLVL